MTRENILKSNFDNPQPTNLLYFKHHILGRNGLGYMPFVSEGPKTSLKLTWRERRLGMRRDEMMMFDGDDDDDDRCGCAVVD